MLVLDTLAQYLQIGEELHADFGANRRAITALVRLLL